MKRAAVFTTIFFVSVLFFAWWASAQSTEPSRIVHVYGQPLSSTLGYLNTLEAPKPSGPANTSSSMTVGSIWISNTDSVTHNVTIEDCQATPALLLSAIPITAGTIWTINGGDQRMQGCMKFQVDSGGTAATVWVWVSGTR
jgi:hypothetical protein